ncbi:YdcF family protein [Profundibacter amoris]|uniref:Uncharacterized protein n=1 Tax=Profundibacter amoris TaxID=2171755 RepID=A0A347UK27_9RHOB|nr:hypothetical protein [Profundibacter amoris]AXX99205.1 hypothetical protein BAR1_15450 [Profundibacter amoris]
MALKPPEFVFVHSYSSTADNWHDVMLGKNGVDGRIGKAQKLADEYSIPLIANDIADARNRKLYRDLGITNLATARNTRDEVVSALKASVDGAVLFVTSPDHLPRVVRDVMAENGVRCLFAASDISFSPSGAKGVNVIEPAHEKYPVHNIRDSQSPTEPDKIASR